MTEGRLETVHNLRPENWDNRRHWTNWHHLYDCEEDHMARESAPFHDLRAGGQFQYEYWGSGPHAEPIEPHKVQERRAGDRMDFSKGRGTGLGGLINIPTDTDAGRPQATTAPKRSTAVHTKKNPLKRGLFSEYEWMPEGPADDTPKNKNRGLDLKNPKTNSAPRAGGMKAGGPVNYIGQHHEYIPDPYNDKADYGRIGKFKGGPVPHEELPWMPDSEPERTPVRHYGPFLAGQPNGSTHINGDIEWIPDPYDKGGLKNDRRPFRTWHTRRKWNMPVAAPWSTGLSTMEPKRGDNFDTTDGKLPQLSTYRRVNMQSTIGKEAALSSMKTPDPVRFRNNNL